MRRIQAQRATATSPRTQISTQTSAASITIKSESRGWLWGRRRRQWRRIYAAKKTRPESHLREMACVACVLRWGSTMILCEQRGKELLDKNVITTADLNDLLKAKNTNDASIVAVGLPCFSFLQTILHSIKAGSNGLLLLDDLEITHLNRPQSRLLDWFFQPVMVLKEQIRVIHLEHGEIQYLEKLVLFGNNTERIKAWDNGSFILRILSEPL